MRFIHCQRCGDTLRVHADAQDAAVAEFYETHGSCPLASYEPTGRSEASGAWSDPMSTRRIEVRGEDGLALAVGVRRLLDEPVLWRLEHQVSEEETSVELDRPAFWATVDRALYPSHLPRRALEEWAAQIDRSARSAHPSDIVLLEDDPQAGDTTLACFTVTARARLEASLSTFGFDETTQIRLSELFDQELFPPLRVRRRLLQSGQSASEASPEASLTR